MGIVERREREKAQTREKILDAARQLFAAHGYEAVTMRQIARKVEYTPTAIYFHFKDKDALLQEICREDFASLAAHFAKLAKIADPVERIRATGHVYIRFALEFPNHYKLMFMTEHAPAELTDEDHAAHGNPDEDAYAFLRAAVEQALAQNRFRPELTDADLLAQTIWAGVHGMASLQICKHADAWLRWKSVKQRGDLMIDMTLRGLLR